MKKKLGIVIILLGLVFAVLVTGPVYVRADSGWDTGYDSGGSDYSSSDYSSSSSYDYDYSSSSSSGGSYSRRSGTSNKYGLYLFLLETFIIIFAIIFYVKCILPKSKTKTVSRYPREYSFVDQPEYSDIAEGTLNSVIPNMTLDELKNEIFNIFVDIQNAWMEFDYDALRKLCTDELYNTYISQLDTLKIKNGKNVMYDFKLNNARVYNIKVENGSVIIEVLMNVSFYDYVIDTTTNKITRGQSIRPVHNTYLMTFVKDKDETLDKCPACGAPIEDKDSTKCRYCRSELVSSSKKFVLSKKNILR